MICANRMDIITGVEYIMHALRTQLKVMSGSIQNTIFNFSWRIFPIFFFIFFPFVVVINIYNITCTAYRTIIMWSRFGVVCRSRLAYSSFNRLFAPFRYTLTHIHKCYIAFAFAFAYQPSPAQHAAIYYKRTHLRIRSHCAPCVNWMPFQIHITSHSSCV